VALAIDFKDPFDYAIVSFKCGDTKLEVVSTSQGSIDQEGNVKTSSLQLTVDVDYCETSPNLECLVGYYRENELLNYETLTAPFDNTKGIVKTHISIPNLGTIPGSYKSRFADFQQALERRKSSWQIKMSCPDDILLEISRKGVLPVMVTLGEITRELTLSDYVFSLNPDLDQLNIPKDLLRQRYSYYAAGCELGIFELLQPDFLAVKNVYYKVLISNTLPLSSFAK
jgi:hypothetical protein